MEAVYRDEAEALITEFNLPRDDGEPIMAEVRRRGLKLEMSQRVDYPPGIDQAVRLLTEDGQEVAYASSEHTGVSLVRALRLVLERDREQPF
jgi:hypothetical protein